MLEQLEQWCVPATYAVGMVSPGTGDPGSTSAVHSGSLNLDPALPATANGRRLIDAPNEAEAIRHALVGAITATLNGPSATYPATAGNIGLSTAAHLPFTLAPLSPPAGTWQLRLEDMVALPGPPPDWDYDDRTWTLTAEVQSVPTVTVTSVTNGAETANGSQPVLFEFTRTNPAAQNPAPPLTVAFTLGGTASPGADYPPPPQPSVSFGPGQMTTVVALNVIDDEANEAAETVTLALTPSQGYSVGSPVVTASIADDDDDATRTVSVRLLGSPEGMPGSTSATISGSLAPAADSYWATPQTDGSVQVDATTAAEAIGLAFAGDISVTFGGDTLISELSAFTVGRSPDAQLPFAVTQTGTDTYALNLEDLARFPIPADWDYNDRTWTFQVVVLAGGPLLPPPPTTPPPSNGEEIVFEKALNPANALATRTELAVSKWKYAFELEGTATDPLAERKPQAKPLAQWVYDDPDSYTVRYKEPAGSINDPTKKDIRVLTLWTTQGANTIEPERDMTFEETGNNTGVFRSVPFILVADDLDDQWDHFSGQTVPCIPDNAADDPTIQVQLDDVVRVKKGAFERSAPVPARAEINVRAYGLDALPAGGILRPVVPVVTDAGVDKQIKYLKSMYAQLGIKVNVLKSNEFPPTYTPPGGQPIAFNPAAAFDPETTDATQKNLQEVLVTNNLTRTPDVPKKAKYIHVYFVKKIADDDGHEALGLAFSPQRQFRIGAGDNIFDNTVLISKDAVDGAPGQPVDVSTLAHEVGHIFQLLHVTSKEFSDTPAPTESEVLKSRTQVMGAGQFALDEGMPDAQVGSTRRVTDDQQNGFKLGQVNLIGVYDKSNEKRGVIDKK